METLPSRILITGGCGFIGSALARRLTAIPQIQILNLDKLSYAANPVTISELNTIPNHQLERCDLADRTTFSGTFKTFRPEAVVHLAAESHVDRSIEHSSTFIDSNIVGTANLLNETLDYYQTLNSADRSSFRFLHISTDEVFGSLAAEGYFSEKTPYSPRSPYSASKASSDHLVSAWHHTYGLPTLLGNCSNNYGPYQHVEKLIPKIILNCMESKSIPIYGKGANIRDWLHVDDHVDALITILCKGKPGEQYCIGSSNEHTNLDIAHAICRMMDELSPHKQPCERLINFVTDRPGHDYRYAIDWNSLQTKLGWEPKIKFEIGLRNTVKWYLENQEWIAASKVTNSEKQVSQ